MYIKMCMIIILLFAFQVSYEQYHYSFEYDGNEREYYVYVPSSLEDVKGLPLLVGLHPYNGSAMTFYNYGFNQKADEMEFIAVYPNALPQPTSRRWNAGGDLAAATNYTDDVGFISAMIDSVIARYSIDSTRVYVTGFSNGSMMSHRVAAELSHKITTIAGVSGQMMVTDFQLARPVPILHIHGLDDNICHYNGGITNGLNIPSVQSSLDIWIEKNGCDTIPDVFYDTNGIQGIKWASADNNADVVLFTIASWGHTWPDIIKFKAVDVICDYFFNGYFSDFTGAGSNQPTCLQQFHLHQNYPNPFNSLTSFRYEIHKYAPVKLSILNVVGQEIETLINTYQTSGYYNIEWQPEGLSSGIYFYRLQAGKYAETKILILQK